MNHFASFSSGLQLIERLVSEESVFCLPGECFDYPNFMRLVLTVPKELMIEACLRIEAFFTRYYVPDPKISASVLSEKNGTMDETVMKYLPVAGT